MKTGYLWAQVFRQCLKWYIRISDTATSDTAEATRGRGMGLPRKYLVGAEQAAMAYKAEASACDAYAYLQGLRILDLQV